MNVLVTGATGHLGRVLVTRLAKANTVHAVVRDASRPLPVGVIAVEWDLGAKDAPQLPEAVDTVIHLAQSRHPTGFPEHAEDIWAVNTESTAKLVRHAAQVGAHSFVLASTGGVYARSPNALGEASPIDLTSFYATSKRCAEFVVEAYQDILRTVIVRPFFLYGPGGADRLFGRLASRIAAKEPIVIDEPDGMLFNPTHIEDAARAIETLMSSKANGVFNLAGPEVITLREIVDRLAALIGMDAHIETRPASGPTALVADASRLANATGFMPSIGIDQGLPTVLQGVGQR